MSKDPQSNRVGDLDAKPIAEAINSTRMLQRWIHSLCVAVRMPLAIAEALGVKATFIVFARFSNWHGWLPWLRYRCILRSAWKGSIEGHLCGRSAIQSTSGIDTRVNFVKSSISSTRKDLCAAELLSRTHLVMTHVWFRKALGYSTQRRTCSWRIAFYSKLLYRACLVITYVCVSMRT